MYSTLAGWCNQPSIFKKFSYRDYCKCKGMSKHYSTYKRDFDSYLQNGYAKGSAWRYMEELEKTFPMIAQEYFDFIPYMIAQYGGDFLYRKCK